MAFYDYHLHSENIEETVKTAKALGFSGICITRNWTNIEDLSSFKKELNQYKGIDIAIGVEIKEKHTKIPDLVNRIRKEAEIILVHGGDLEVNRIAVETPGVDILLHPELGREDSGLNHVMINQLAKKNNVSIEFSLNDIIQSSNVSRARLLEKMLFNAKLVKKYKAPFVLTSGAFDSQWMRSRSELFGLGHVLGFQDPEIKKALSDSIVKENRKRLSGRWIMPGVEVV